MKGHRPGRDGSAWPGLYGLGKSPAGAGSPAKDASAGRYGPAEALQGRTVNSDDAGLGEEDPVALLPHLGGEAVLAGLGGGEGEAPHRDGPGDVRGPGHPTAGKPLTGITDVADLAPAGPGHR